MIELHPQFLTKNGQEFVLLPSEEFTSIQKLLENLDELEALMKLKETNSQTSPLENLKEMQQKQINDWKKAISQIDQKDIIKQQQRINQLLDSWDNLDDENEQKEILAIIQSID
ncbi:MAG: hypothetical protein QNJ08_07295 [Crocosphaera sp.]|nr:hypothetical protein [Crocosphaera sp.]